MAYFPTIFLVSGDDKPDIDLTLKDSNTAASGYVLDPNDSDTWAPINISTIVVTVDFRALGGSSILDTLSCTNTSPTAGECTMEWNLTTLDVAAGVYEGEIVLTYADGRINTLYDKLKFKIREDF